MTGGKDLLYKLLSSEAKGDLLVLFHRNTGLIDTVDGIGRRIGRTGEVIAKDIEDLVDLGILKRNKVGNSEVLCLNREGNKETLEAVATYIGEQKWAGLK